MLCDALELLRDWLRGAALAPDLLKSKDEALLNDALAERLREVLAYSPSMNVVREWGDGVVGMGGKRVDIAVQDGTRPLALVEAKVAMSFDLVKGGKQPFPIKAVKNDIQKLNGISFNGKRFILLFVVHNHQVPVPKQSNSLTYYDGMRSHGPIDADRLQQGFERFRRAIGDVHVFKDASVPAGRAYGVDVSVLYWLMAA